MRSAPRPCLIIKASGGMSNRLQALLAGLAYCLLSDRTLRVDWRDSLYGPPGINSFPYFFDLAGLPYQDQENLPERGQIFPPFWADKLECPAAVEYLFDNDHMSPANVARSSLDFSRLDYQAAVLVGWAWNLAPALKLAPLLRERFPEFNRPDDRRLISALAVKHLIPRPEIMERVDRFHQEHFSGPMAGLHIRHSDLTSPLENFISQARSLRQQGLRIFLCTDNAQVERTFKNLFPDLVSMDKFFPRPGQTLHSHYEGQDNVEKGRQTLIEMFLLGYCAKIVRYAKSSFADIPTLFFDIPAERIIHIT